MTKETAVSELIHWIREDPKAKKPANRNIVIIYQGRILQPTDILSSIESLDEFTVHAFFRAIRLDSPADPDPSVELRGFDRLSRMDYTPEQILEIRQNFHILHGTMEETHEDRLDAEEEWFPVLFNQDNPLQDLLPRRARRPRRNVNPIANNREEELPGQPEERALDNFPWLKFICGLIMGLIFGVGSLVFLLIAMQDGPFMFGLFWGACGHYALKYYFGADLM
jgi:hypothetical protein